MTYEAAGRAEIVRPCWFVYLDILDDPLFAWTGGYDIAITGQGDSLLNNTFLGTSGLVEIGEVADERGGGPGTPITLSGVDPALPGFDRLIAEGRLWQGRRAVIWQSYTNEAGQPIFDPRRVKTGRMDNLRFEQGGDTGTLTLDIEGFAAHAQQALNTRYAEQRDIDPTDTSQNWVHDLANKQPDVGATGQGTNKTSGGGGGGGGGSDPTQYALR